jgi:hypothetical protein
MARRDAFSGLRGSPSSNADDESRSIDMPTFSEKQDIKQPLDLIPTAQRRKKRNRDWEQAHRAETVTYRGVPRECHEWIEEIADGLSVPRDEVVRAFLEFGVKQYHWGQLALIVFPKAQRMTLYPEGDKKTLVSPSQSKEISGWLNEAFPVATKRERGVKKKKGKKDGAVPHRWEIRVTYRIPILLKEEIRSIAEEHTLPVGEVVWFFIEQALKAFRDGNLPLQPAPKVIGKTLFQDRC